MRSIAPPSALRSPMNSSRRGGMPAWAIILLAIIIIGTLLIIAVCGGLVWLGSTAPPTHVVAGTNLRDDFEQTINDLGLLEPDETIRYFYSDGLMDIEEGMYFLTDRKLVIYSNLIDPEFPAETIPLEQIYNLELERDTSFMFDSYIAFETDDFVYDFPVSSERGGDQRFFNALREAARDARIAAGLPPDGPADAEDTIDDSP